MQHVLSFHPKAETQYNKLGYSLIQSVEKKPTEGDKKESERSWFSPHLAATIKLEDIKGTMKLGKIDNLGATLERYFQVGRELHGLNEKHFPELMKLAEKIYNTSSFHKATTYESIVDTIFEWVEQSYKESTEADLCNFIVEHLSKTIGNHEIWVPLAGLAIETKFTFGTVTFVPITTDLVDTWQKEMIKNSPNNRDNIYQFCTNIRRKHKGWAAGIIHINAEYRRAQEIAVADVDRALALLRFFSPANMSPHINCIATVFGNQLIRSETTFKIVSNSLNAVNTRIIRNDLSPWLVSSEMIKQWQKEGLSELSSLHFTGSSTEFHSAIVNSLMLYSKVSVSKELPDKLVYLFSSVESILLKDSGEPIQYVVSERMATILGGSSRIKKRLIANFKKMYGKRSQLIHHAKSIELTKEVSQLMRDVWMTFFCIIKQMHLFRTKQEFLDEIDERKLGGSS